MNLFDLPAPPNSQVDGGSFHPLQMDDKPQTPHTRPARYLVGPGQTSQPGTQTNSCKFDGASPDNSTREMCLNATHGNPPAPSQLMPRNPTRLLDAAEGRDMMVRCNAPRSGCPGFDEKAKGSWPSTKVRDLELPTHFDAWRHFGIENLGEFSCWGASQPSLSCVVIGFHLLGCALDLWTHWTELMAWLG